MLTAPWVKKDYPKTMIWCVEKTEIAFPDPYGAPSCYIVDVDGFPVGEFLFHSEPENIISYVLHQSSPSYLRRTVANVVIGEDFQSLVDTIILAAYLQEESTQISNDKTYSLKGHTPPIQLFIGGHNSWDLLYTSPLLDKLFKAYELDEASILSLKEERNRRKEKLENIGELLGLNTELLMKWDEDGTLFERINRVPSLRRLLSLYLDIDLNISEFELNEILQLRKNVSISYTQATNSSLIPTKAQCGVEMIKSSLKPKDGRTKPYLEIGTRSLPQYSSMQALVAEITRLGYCDFNHVPEFNIQTGRFIDHIDTNALLKSGLSPELILFKVSKAVTYNVINLGEISNESIGNQLVDINSISTQLFNDILKGHDKELMIPRLQQFVRAIIEITKAIQCQKEEALEMLKRLGVIKNIPNELTGNPIQKTLSLLSSKNIELMNRVYEKLKKEGDDYKVMQILMENDRLFELLQQSNIA